jgi:PTS system mannose-specific IIA component
METSDVKGRMEGVLFVSVNSIKGVEDLKKEIGGAIKKVDTGDGVMILTDLFGGTPSNLSLSFLKEGKVEVVTGVNLPMLMKLDMRQEKKLTELAALIRDYGRKNIYLASEVLNKDIKSN